MREVVYSVPVITNAWRLFHDRWAVTLPSMYVFDQNELDNMVVPKIQGLSRTEMFSQHVKSFLPLSRLIDIYAEGGDIRLVDYKDALPMFNLLRGHMLDLVEAHKAMIPIPCNDDLVALDEMAKTLHHSCLYIKDPAKIQNDFGGSILTLSRLYRGVNPIVKEGEQNIIKYRSVIAHLITEPVALGERVWQ